MLLSRFLPCLFDRKLTLELSFLFSHFLSIFVFPLFSSVEKSFKVSLIFKLLFFVLIIRFVTYISKGILHSRCTVSLVLVNVRNVLKLSLFASESVHN